jgi:hypothetical protein
LDEPVSQSGPPSENAWLCPPAHLQRDPDVTPHNQSLRVLTLTVAVALAAVAAYFFITLAVINAVGVCGRLTAAHLTVHAATEQQASTVGARIEEQAHVVGDRDRRIALIATKLSQKRRRKVTLAPYITRRCTVHPRRCRALQSRNNHWTR